MSGQGLREALEELVEERLADDGTPTGFLITPHELRVLLAAHPVEPVQAEIRHQADIAAGRVLEAVRPYLSGEKR